MSEEKSTISLELGTMPQAPDFDLEAGAAAAAEPAIKLTTAPEEEAAAAVQEAEVHAPYLEDVNLT